MTVFLFICLPLFANTKYQNIENKIIKSLNGSPDQLTDLGVCPSTESIAFWWVWDYQFYVQLFENNLEPLTDPMNLSTCHYGAEIETMDDGSYIILKKFYNHSDFGGLILYKLSQKGKLAHLYSTPTRTAQMKRALYILDDNTIFLSWSGDPNVEQQDDRANDIFAILLDSSGAVVQGPFPLNTNFEGRNRDGQLLSLHNKDFVYVWERVRSDNKLYKYFQKYSTSFEPLGQAYLLWTNDGEKLYQLFCTTHAMSFESGRFMISWEIRYEQDSYEDIYAQYFTNEGVPLAERKRINSFRTGQQKDHRICKVGENVLFAWYNQLHNGVYHRIVAQLLDDSGQNLGDNVWLPRGAWGQEYPDILNLSPTRALIWWYDDRGVIYSRIYDDKIGWIDAGHDVLNTYIRSRVRFVTLKLRKSEKNIICNWCSRDEDQVNLYALVLPGTDKKRELASFAIKSPENDATINETIIKVEWQNPSQQQELVYPTEVSSTVFLSKTPGFENAQKFNAFCDTTRLIKNLIPGSTYFVRVLSQNAYDDSIWSSNTVAFFVTHDANVSHQKEHPYYFALYQNFPNPFNPVTDIGYDLNTSGFIKLTIYNIAGKQVKELVHEYKNAGSHKVLWDGQDDLGNDVAAGVYLYQLHFIQNDGRMWRETKKMSLVK